MLAGVLVQSAVTRKRPPCRQSVVASGTHGPAAAGASQLETDGKVTRKAPSTVRLSFAVAVVVGVGAARAELLADDLQVRQIGRRARAAAAGPAVHVHASR